MSKDIVTILVPNSVILIWLVQWHHGDSIYRHFQTDKVTGSQTITRSHYNYSSLYK